MSRAVPKYPAGRSARRGGGRRPPVRLRYLLLLLLALGLYRIAGSGLNGGTAAAPPLASDHENAAIIDAAKAMEPQPVVTEYRVKKGDTFYTILKDLGVPDDSIMSLADKKVDGVNLSRLVAGRPYRVVKHKQEVVEYQYEPDDDRIVRVSLDDAEPGVVVEPIPYTISISVVSGTIEESLFGAVDAAGERPMLAMDLADVYAWQIDFFRDLRKGDSFRVLVEKVIRDGKFVRYGDILAAEFINAGKRFTAYLYRPENGRADYFDEEGGSLRKQFLKAPLRFRRISSGFSRARLHPVTGRVQPHLGVDYTAPIGTPVRAIGDGKVVLKRTDRANGKILKVRHNSVYSSAYAHLNSFASGIRNGSRVKQGQIIGYVGKTGRATGPHLHFAMYRNGRYVDPRRINVPRASSVPSAEKVPYLELVQERTLQLGGRNGETLALTDRE